jgi:Flp pilus assembly protein TadD
MTRAWVLALLGLLLALPNEGLASEESKQLSTRGLEEFHADHMARALELFDQAVAADPNDPYAHYYRAIARERSNDLSGAISDLRRALALKPDFNEAALELGIALVQTESYREALPWLEQAQHVWELDGRASMFRGIAHLRLGDYALARLNFERAAERDPAQKLAANYYLGVVAYRTGEWGTAARYFAYVRSENAASPLGRESAKFIDKINAELAVEYSAYAGSAFEYDSNVILAQTDAALANQSLTTLGVSHQADGRFVLTFGGWIVPWRTPRWELSLGYDFYQSLHFSLTKYNIQDNGPSVQLMGWNGPLQYGVLGRYDYYLRSTNSFLQEATALPWVAYEEGTFGRTEVFFRMLRRDFKQFDFVLRDGFNYSTGAWQYFYLGSPDRYVLVGYRWDRDDPVVAGSKYSAAGLPQTTPQMYADEALSFGYDGNEGRVGVGWLLPWQIAATGTFFFRHEEYRPESDGRRDNEELILVDFRRPISDHLTAIVGYVGDFNNSNNPYFDFNRSIGSIALEARF